MKSNNKFRIPPIYLNRKPDHFSYSPNNTSLRNSYNNNKGESLIRLGSGIKPINIRKKIRKSISDIFLINSYAKKLS